MSTEDEFRAIRHEPGAATEPTAAMIRAARRQAHASPIVIGPFHPQDTDYLWLKAEEAHLRQDDTA